MLYEFKCRATGSVVATEPVGEKLLAIIGKAPGPKGIITVEQIPAAIRALQAAVAEDRADERSAAGGDDDEALRGREVPVALAQRAWPLIEMLKAALAAKMDVTWGV